jgi:hypothetical protein
MANEYDDPEIDPTLEYKPLNIPEIQKNIQAYASTKLCEMIVCDRYFECYREVAIICMEELARRRQAGDDFLFENYIDQAFDKLPKLNLTGLNLRDILTQAIKQKGNS